MLALQAGVVAAPRAVARPRALDRFMGRWWALVPVGSIVAVIFAIRYASATATGLTYLALVAVPPLAAVALAWAGRGPQGWLVVSDLLQAPNATLIAAQPAAGLPRLQSEVFGSVSMGYGDMFVAGLLGAVVAANRRTQWAAAVLTLLLASAMDVLFLVLDELPATVPVAVALIVIEAVGAFRRRRMRSEQPRAAPSMTPSQRWDGLPATPRRARNQVEQP
jgi:hypothetical protein